jgi:hypothetical protein
MWPINTSHAVSASFFTEYHVENEIPYEIHFSLKETPLAGN